MFTEQSVLTALGPSMQSLPYDRSDPSPRKHSALVLQLSCRMIAISDEQQGFQ
jgi:hypothetical protein